jgi:hypothetical protein
MLAEGLQNLIDLLLTRTRDKGDLDWRVDGYTVWVAVKGVVISVRDSGAIDDFEYQLRVSEGDYVVENVTFHKGTDGYTILRELYFAGRDAARDATLKNVISALQDERPLGHDDLPF